MIINGCVNLFGIGGDDFLLVWGIEFEVCGIVQSVYYVCVGMIEFGVDVWDLGCVVLDW